MRVVSKRGGEMAIARRQELSGSAARRYVRAVTKRGVKSDKGNHRLCGMSSRPRGGLFLGGTARKPEGKSRRRGQRGTKNPRRRHEPTAATTVGLIAKQNLNGITKVR
ncbi:hypothetical protein KM043_008128 [Ampulex compressa]|nr:hypothetical protein KM043_008128 [Ampulex compressa]